MKHLFIINPHSFIKTGIMEQVLAEIKNCFSDSRSADYKIHVSRYTRDAINIIHRYIRHIPSDEKVRIYAVGGDGILFDCLNGMAIFPNAELTNVPYGNANDYVLTFGPDAIPAFRDIKNLINAPSRPVDIIDYGANYALIEANVGLVGQLVIYSNPVLRGVGRSWIRHFMGAVYNISGLRAILNKEVMRQHYTVLVDGEDESGCYSNIHVSNGALTGSGMVADPYAVPDDGLLDVIYTCTTSRLEVARAMKNYERGWFEKYKFFRHRKFRKMEIKSEHPLRVQLDGACFSAQELKLEIIPGGIRFIAPESMNFFDYSHRAFNKEGKNEG